MFDRPSDGQMTGDGWDDGWNGGRRRDLRTHPDDRRIRSKTFQDMVSDQSLAFSTVENAQMHAMTIITKTAYQMVWN